MEIKTAVMKMALGKTPGNDGLGIKFYKCFNDQLSYWTQNPCLPLCAMLLFLCYPKPGKDPVQMVNYRPLSLLNTVYKILRLRLEKAVPSIIHSDQAGFIPGHLSSNNMHRVLQIILHAGCSTLSAIAASLNAEKAFDKVLWQYLFYTFKKFSFGSKFINWLEAPYSSPRSSVKTNGLISKPFALQRGVRKGCPVSPLLFIIALEPLRCAICSNADICDVDFCGYSFKLNTYADDILLMLSKLNTSSPSNDSLN